MKKLFFILSLIAVSLLAYYCVSGHVGDIQQDIKTRLSQGLESENISKNISAKVSGRDVVLMGSVSEENSQKRAGQIAKALYGVRAVDNQINVVEPPPLAVITPEPEPDLEMEVSSAPVMPAIEEEPMFNLDLLSLDEVSIAVVEPSEEVEQEEPELIVDETLIINLDEAEEVDIADAVTEAVEPDILVQVEEETDVVNELIEAVELAPVVAECQGELASILEQEKINFAMGQAVIKSSSYALLNRISDEAKKCNDSVIHIHGYTDSSGDVKVNTSLSLRRAKSVGKYLISKGVRQEIRVIGNGPNDPVAENDTEEGRAENRRIEFKVLKVTTE